MSLILRDRQIQRIQIVDDDPYVRESHKELVEDMELLPVNGQARLPNLDQFILDVQQNADAAICDHHLTPRQYASFKGAEAVATLYHQRFPAILCTKYEEANLDEIRPFRRQIPVLLTPSELNLQSVRKGFEICVEEFNNNYLPSRRPWRTLIRVDDADNVFAYLIVPAWNPQRVVRLLLSEIPTIIRQRIESGQERFHAKVNIGAEQAEDLYFTDWEER